MPLLSADRRVTLLDLSMEASSLSGARVAPSFDFRCFLLELP